MLFLKKKKKKVIQHENESQYSHMCISLLHDPILPYVHTLREYALACLATCAVHNKILDPILPHVQSFREYELVFTQPNLT